MKKVILASLMVIATIVFVGCNKNSVETQTENVVRKGKKFVFKFGTYSRPCDCNGNGTTEGCSGDKGVCLVIGFEKTDDFSIPLESNTGIGEIAYTAKPTALLSMLVEENPADPDIHTVFYVYEDIDVTDSDDGFVIKAGEYLIDYSTNPLGDVVLDVE